MLAAILTTEFVLVVVATVLAAAQLAGHGAKVEADGVAFLVCLVIGCLWVGSTALGAWFAQPWFRGLAITWQLLQLAVGVGALEGLVGTPLAGVVLLALGVAGVILALSRPVTRALAREPR